MALVAFVGCLVAVVTYQLAAPATGADNPVRASVLAASKTVRTTPSASAFARLFVRDLNAYAVSQKDHKRLANAHCVQAAKGRYMCSYRVVRPGGAAECHIMQARWTARMPITVTRAGRAARCESLRAALHSLR